ncbi:hypothetical protein [Xanthobacter sediminis]
MTPAAAIAALNRQLRLHGQDVVLRRYIVVSGVRTPVDATVRASVRDFRPDELAGGIVQGDTQVVLSPSGIIAAAWPGPQDWPRIGDRVEIDGRERAVQAAPVVRMAGTVVRINMQVRG